MGRKIRLTGFIYIVGTGGKVWASWGPISGKRKKNPKVATIIGNAISSPTSNESVPTESFVKSVLGAGIVADDTATAFGAGVAATAATSTAFTTFDASAANILSLFSSSILAFCNASACNFASAAAASFAAAALAISPELLHSVSEVSPPSIIHFGVSVGSDCDCNREIFEKSCIFFDEKLNIPELLLDIKNPSACPAKMESKIRTLMAIMI